MAIAPIITTAGLGAVFNATHDGVNANISHIALGDGAWSPTADASELENEINRISISGGERLGEHQIHITAVENGAQEYWIREVGFYLDDGTLFALWSDTDQALAYKAANVDVLLAFDLVLSAVPDGRVDVLGTGGVNLAPATDTVLGLVRLASSPEALAGELDSVAMSPSKVREHSDARYPQKTHGHDWDEVSGKPSSFVPSSHSHTWASIQNRPDSFTPSEHSHPWTAITNTPASYPPSTHTHSWSALENKPASFTPSAHSHDWSALENRPSTYPASSHGHTKDEISDLQGNGCSVYVLEEDLDSSVAMTMEPVTQLVAGRRYRVKGTIYVSSTQTFGQSPGIDVDASAATAEDIKGFGRMYYDGNLRVLEPRVIELSNRVGFFPRFDLYISDANSEGLALFQFEVSFTASVTKSFRMYFSINGSGDEETFFHRGSVIECIEAMN